MQPVLRLAARAPRASRRSLTFRYAAQPRRLASQSYGNEQSGMEQGTDQKNPKADMEHPGPEAPAKKGTDTSSSSPSKSQSGTSSETTSHGGSPAISRPESAAEKDNPDVRKHNEEMEQRHERSVNQLSEEDNKVDKNFWKGESIQSL